MPDPGVVTVWRFEDLALADADAVDPFGDHDTACGEVVVHHGDVDTVAQSGFGGDEGAHAVGVGGLVEEIGFLPEPGGDVGCEVRQWEGEQFFREEIGHCPRGGVSSWK